MFKKFKILAISLFLIYVPLLETNAMKENFKETTPLKTYKKPLISFSKEKEIFYNCCTTLFNIYKNINEVEYFDLNLSNDVLQLISLANKEMEELEKIEKSIQTNKNLIILYNQYSKIFKNIIKRIDNNIKILNKKLYDIKEYKNYSNFDFSFSEEEIEQEDLKKEKEIEKEKNEKIKEKTIITYKTVLENIIKTIESSYKPILENLINLIEKTYSDLLKNFPKIKEIQTSIETEIKINKEKKEELKSNFEKLKTNFKKDFY